MRTSVWQTPLECGVSQTGYERICILPMVVGYAKTALTEATISIRSSPSPGWRTLTSSSFQPPLLRVSRQTIALASLEVMARVVLRGL